MPSPISPENMSTEDRCREVAFLLARGILRSRKQHRFSQLSDSEKPSEVTRQGLELSGPARLSGTVG